MRLKCYNILASAATTAFTIVAILILMMVKPAEIIAAIPPVSIGGIINSYARVTTLDQNNKRLTVDNIYGNPGDFNIGSKVLIIQMKGATINVNNDSNFGRISNLNNAGSYEFATVANRSENTIWLGSLERNYTQAGNIQLVSIPQYTSAQVSSNITAAPWDPAQGRGGIVVFEVKHELVLSANIQADGAGFRGGAVNTRGNSNDANDNTYRADQASGYGKKGEGIAAYVSNQEYGRGPLANGGGGGNTHNAGGGGGGNFTTAGSGGTGWPQNNVEGGDGFGGYGFTYDSDINKIFMGGGGGSGQQNDGQSSAGANGGGIIIIRAGKLNATRTSTISANGGNANNTSGNDGAGGAGGGGTILLDVLDYANDIEVHVAAKGGNGGNVDSGDKHGGGGGGGSGAVLFNTPPSNKIIIDNQPGKAGNDRRDGSTTAKPGSAPCLSSNCDPITGWPPIGNLTPLPVELLYFKGKAAVRTNTLEWATASEKNNDYFTVERSTDGKFFFYLADVKGNGTKNTHTSYTFEDKGANGISYYYRLTQTDFNGAQTTHSIIYIPGLTAQEPRTIKIGPNPFTNKLFIDLDPHIEQSFDIYIYDESGKVIFEKHFEASQKQTHEFDIQENLPSGIYYLQIRGSRNRDAVKIIKQ